jgi:uncharacterized protein (TIGR02453 family)
VKNALKFLSDLEKHNDRDWFHSNKTRYQEAKAVFERFIEELICAISAFDDAIAPLTPKRSIFRLERDIRFARDKTPYNPSFRACLSIGGKAPIPTGYYISIAPNNRSFLGGGLYASTFKEASEAIRNKIADRGEEFEKIINAKEFAKVFKIQGEKLKNAPIGFDKNAPQIEYIKHKSWYLQYSVSDEETKADNFVEKAARIYKVMKPFNDYLNVALKEIKTPQKLNKERNCARL